MSLMNRCSRRIALVLALVVALPLGVGGGGTAASRPNECKRGQGKQFGPFTVKLKFVGVQHSGEVRHDDHFEIQDLRDLLIVTDWENGSVGRQRVEVFAPDGSLYRMFTAPLDVAADPHHPHKLRPIQTKLPVGGTWITEYSLTGRWCVKVFLEGADAPAVARRFVLKP